MWNGWEDFCETIYPPREKTPNAIEVLAAWLRRRIVVLRLSQSCSVQSHQRFRAGLFTNTVVGPLIDVSAYSFAPQSLVAPFGGPGAGPGQTQVRPAGLLAAFFLLLKA